MARAIRLSFPLRSSLVVVIAAVLGGVLGFASAQDATGGRLDTECMSRCTTNGYETAFCESVCWVPDSAASAKADNLDWKCFGRCTKQGGRAEPCLASCRQY